MDPLSITAGVAGLLQLCLSAASALSEYKDNYKDAPKELHHLAVQAQALTGIVHEVQDALLEAHAPKDKSETGRAPALGKGLQSLRSVIDECVETIRQVQGLLDDIPRDGRLARAKSSALWHFRKTKFEAHAKRLGSHVQLFSLALCVHAA